MVGSLFVPEVKERQADQPCFIALITGDDIGLGQRMIIFDMPEGTQLEQAREFANLLRKFRVRVRLS
jgi:hypothetical protein